MPAAEGRLLLLLGAAALLGGGAFAACTERAITEVEPGGAPGATVETREVRLPAEALPRFRDTAFVGFALPGDAGWVLAATESELQARVLARFSDIPDSVSFFFDTVFLAVDSFLNASLFVRMDTAASAFPEFPFTLRLLSLTRGFDGRRVTWTEAAPGEPWTTPGGDLGTPLGSTVVGEPTDTLAFPLEVTADSLLVAWREAGGEPGVALVVDEPGASLRIQQFILRFDVRPEGRQDSLREVRGGDPLTFIYDPVQPAPAGGLRIGGLPAWRTYIAFRPPDTVAGVPLRGATVNRAELILHPLEPPPGPLRPEKPLAGRAIELFGDPFRLGPKTPVGASSPTGLSLDPDSLAAGRPLRVDVTALLVEQSFAEDSVSEVWVGVRADPDAQGLGFWDFGSVENPVPTLRPELLVVISPPAGFRTP